MTSIGSVVKQIPLNNGYYRVVPALIATTQTLSPLARSAVSSFMYTFNSGVIGNFTPANATVESLLSTGSCLLKDMGVNYVYPGSNGVGTAAQYNTPIQYRRVQIVDSTGGTATDGVTGTSSGLDSDFGVAYIQLGLKGNAAPGPFIRTG